MNEFCAGEHGGTHMDAPYHFNKFGAKIGQLPLENFIARGKYLYLFKYRSSCFCFKYGILKHFNNAYNTKLVQLSNRMALGSIPRSDSLANRTKPLFCHNFY